jgi:hypothetical protein
VAQYGRRGSVECGVAQLGCSVAQLVVRRQVRVQLSARRPREVDDTELTGGEEMDQNIGEWRWMNVLYECDGMYACTKHIK